jgi:CelD/BcsL family acetyltransferase involved in cellulose biosynthesis
VLWTEFSWAAGRFFAQSSALSAYLFDPDTRHLDTEMLMPAKPKYTVTEETFDSIHSFWQDPQQRLKWDCLFVLPVWLKVWWDNFGSEQTAYLCAVRHKDELMGIAPFMVEGKTARLMGDPDVCDCLDVIVARGREKAFFQNLIRHLKQHGIAHLDLGALRADSSVMRYMVSVARDLNCEVACKAEDVSMEMELPSTWDGFLDQLTGKERHELRRKLRRLNEAARINFRAIENPAEVRKEIDTFLALFKLNRSDKSNFMTDQRAAFFRELAEEMAGAGILKLFFLDLDDTPAAAVMCFDYHSTMYLYNNGYDNRHRSLSIGLLSKVLTIKNSIQTGKNKYDFLKGTESYKRRLGGKAVQLYRCRIHIG